MCDYTIFCRFGNVGGGPCGVFALNDSMNPNCDGVPHREAPEAARRKYSVEFREHAAKKLREEGPSGCFWTLHGAKSKQTLEEFADVVLGPDNRLDEVHMLWIAECENVNLLLLTSSLTGSHTDGLLPDGPVFVAYRSYMLADTKFPETVILHHRDGGGGDLGGGHFEAVLYRTSPNPKFEGKLPVDHELVNQLCQVADGQCTLVAWSALESLEAPALDALRVSIGELSAPDAN